MGKTAPLNTGPSAIVGSRQGRLPRGVWGLGFTSLFMDSSSELVHSVLPVFMVSTLGAGMATIGFVEGIAEATAAAAKVFSGALSDRARKRKHLIVAGYGLAALSKLLFPMARSITWVMGGRFVDRLGKGLRGAPRDAMVADLTPQELRGEAYGLRQSMDSVGAFLGPLLAIVLLAGLGISLRALLWFAVLPAFLAVAVLVLMVKEPARSEASVRTMAFLGRAELRKLSGHFWIVAAVGMVFSLARFSEAFLLLRGNDLGLTAAWVPVVLLVMNLVYSASAWPIGIASDRLGTRGLLVIGLIPLIAADLLLALASSPTWVLAGAALWGLHMGMSQGLLSRMVADTSPECLWGTSFGIFNLASGCALLLSSLMAGILWQVFGPPVTFTIGGLFALIAGLGLLIVPSKARPA